MKFSKGQKIRRFRITIPQITRLPNGLDGWMVKKFSSTFRLEVDPRPELREVKPRSTRKYQICACEPMRR